MITINESSTPVSSFRIRNCAIEASLYCYGYLSLSNILDPVLCKAMETLQSLIQKLDLRLTRFLCDLGEEIFRRWKTSHIEKTFEILVKTMRLVEKSRNALEDAHMNIIMDFPLSTLSFRPAFYIEMHHKINSGLRWIIKNISWKSR